MLVRHSKKKKKSVFLKSHICFCSEHLLFLHIVSRTLLHQFCLYSPTSSVLSPLPWIILLTYKIFPLKKKKISWYPSSSYCPVSLLPFIAKHIETNCVVVIYFSNLQIPFSVSLEQTPVGFSLPSYHLNCSWQGLHIVKSKGQCLFLFNLSSFDRAISPHWKHFILFASRVSHPLGLSPVSFADASQPPVSLADSESSPCNLNTEVPHSRDSYLLYSLSFSDLTQAHSLQYPLSY